MAKDLLVGKDYYEIFGNDTTGNKKLIYNGGISWTAIMGNQSMTKDSQQQTDTAIAYINKSSYKVGV